MTLALVLGMGRKIARLRLFRMRHAGAAIIYSDRIPGADGEAMFRRACRMGLEGIVSKREWREISRPIRRSLLLAPGFEREVRSRLGGGGRLAPLLLRGLPSRLALPLALTLLLALPLKTHLESPAH